MIREFSLSPGKGFWLMEMTAVEDAQKAISALNGNALMDRAIIVKEARPLHKRGDFGGGGPGFSPSCHASSSVQ
jgi:hypothetical protein